MKLLAPAFAFLVLLMAIVYALFHMGFLGTSIRATSSEKGLVLTDQDADVEVAETLIDVQPIWEFRFIEDGVSDVMNPQTDVSLSFKVGSDARTEGPYRLGSVTGSCSEQTPGEEEIAHALCWFAGFGTAFSVVQEGREVRVLRAEIEEGTGEFTPPPAEYGTILTVTL